MSNKIQGIYLTRIDGTDQFEASVAEERCLYDEEGNHLRNETITRKATPQEVSQLANAALVEANASLTQQLSDLQQQIQHVD